MWHNSVFFKDRFWESCLCINNGIIIHPNVFLLHAFCSLVFYRSCFVCLCVCAGKHPAESRDDSVRRQNRRYDRSKSSLRFVAKRWDRCRSAAFFYHFPLKLQNVAFIKNIYFWIFAEIVTMLWQSKKKTFFQC